ncbi:MAG: hypothetical protein AB1925_12675 [Actinomycetota bacterium]
MSRREEKRLALQSTAEIWQGLNVVDAALRAGQFTIARDTIQQVREVVKLADAAWVEQLRDLAARQRDDFDDHMSHHRRDQGNVRCLDCNLRYDEREEYSCTIEGTAHTYDADDLAEAMHCNDPIHQHDDEADRR